MTAYIQDQNNAENITNDVTVLNVTNYGNLTYKVDELQFVLNELHKYKHTTILSSIKDTWASKSWTNSDDGVKSDDATNYILNGKSVKFTGDAQNDGMHVEKTLDLTIHSDGYTAGADDIITIFAYITSQDLTDLGSSRFAISFLNDILGTVTNYYWARFDDQLKAGKNIIKLKKSDFTGVGSPDWSTIRGIDIHTYNAAPDAETNISIDMILLHTQEFKNFVYKTTNETLSSNITMQNDDELVVTLPQNGIFEITAHIAANSSSATPDIKTDWSVSGDVTLLGLRYCLGQSVNVSNSNDSGNIKLKVEETLTVDVEYGMDGSVFTYIKENFIVQTLNDGGTLQLRWAQHTSNASAIAVKPGSYIKVTQLQ